jgi:hypothetical protein
MFKQMSERVKSLTHSQMHNHSIVASKRFVRWYTDPGFDLRDANYLSLQVAEHVMSC